MPQQLRYLAIHGLGDHRGQNWHQPWQNAIQDSFNSFGLGAKTPTLAPETYTFDPLFEKVDLSFQETTTALAKLVASGFGSLFDEIIPGRRSRSKERSIDQTIRWTAGYVVAWLEDDEFRAQTRQDIYRLIKAQRPQILLAHSLGSLITYDALSQPEAARDSQLQSALANMIYVVFGSQIGNPFVRRNLVPGRKLHVPGQTRHFIHLFNDTTKS